MPIVENSSAGRVRWVWTVVMTAALALLVVGGLKIISSSIDAENNTGSLKRKSPPLQSVPEDENADASRIEKGTGKTLSVTSDTSKSQDRGRGMTKPPRTVPGTNIEMTGQPQYPIVSTEIYEWAKTKTAEELIELINQNYSLVSVEGTRDANGNEIKAPQDNETSVKASLALALRLRDDTSLYPVFRAAFLSGQLAALAASRLVEILGLMRDDKATDLLLELVNLPQPTAPIRDLLLALRERTGVNNLRPFEDYIDGLDYKEPARRGFPIAIGADDRKLPEARVIETFLSLFDHRMAGWSDRDKGALFGAFQNILSVYQEVSQGTKKEEVAMDHYCEQILERIEWLARNSTDPSTKQSALSLLTIYPQGERSYVPLLDALRDPNDRVRLTAIDKLAAFNNQPEVVTALIDAARNDSYEGNRRSAIESLPSTGVGGQEKLTLSLAWYTPNAKYMTRQEAISLLGGCGLEAIPHLERIAREDTDPELRAQAKLEIGTAKSMADFDRRVEEVEKKKEEMRKQREELKK